MELKIHLVYEFDSICQWNLFSFLIFSGSAVQHGGSWFPDQGLNLCPLQWKHGVLTTGRPRTSQLIFYWSIVELQCCVNYSCTAKWFSYTFIYILFHFLFHYGLSQDIEYRFLCSTVVSLFYIYQSTPLPLPSPLAFYPYVPDSVSISQVGSFVSRFRFHI